MIQINCANCRSLLAFEDADAGRVVACPDCAAKVRIPEPLEELDEPETRNTVVVRMMGQPRWQLFDMAVPIVVDGRQVGEGSVKTGFDVVVKMPVGDHTVEIGPASHELDFPRKGHYEVEFAYSTMWGKYSVPPKVFPISTDEAAGWPMANADIERSAGRRSRRRAEANDPIDLDSPDGAVSVQDEAVLFELERLQTQKSGWGGAIGLLVISLILFMGAAGVQEIWESLIFLVPVLAFHELGHYLAMLVFGYRNIRMFFIPFLGAAVSGRHYNVAGWKKAIVALAGPLPGILVGAAVGAAALIVGAPKLVVDAALFALALNGFNLLPFLPLDGGWVVHAVLFVRHPVLDIVFRVAAALCLVGLAIFMQNWCLGAVALFMLVAAPMAYRTARIAQRLGKEGLVTRSLDNQSIPTDAALRILAELRRVLPPQTPAATMAQHVANVFEAYNAEPPDVSASLGLLALHAGGFILALVVGVVIIATQHQPG
jgi:Zn-dependent protease